MNHFQKPSVGVPMNAGIMSMVGGTMRSVAIASWPSALQAYCRNSTNRGGIEASSAATNARLRLRTIG